MTVIQEIVPLKEIERHLRCLGISRNYKGFSRFAYAVALVLDNESRLEAVVKEVYMPVGEFCGCSWSAVERSIRVVCSHVWYEGCDQIYEATGIRFKRYPTPSELLDTVSVYIKDQKCPDMSS